VAVPDQRCHSASKTRVNALVAPLRYALHRVRDTMASDCRGTRWLVRSPYFPVFLRIRNLPSPVSRSQAHTPPPSRGARLRPGFASLLHSPRVEGWAERRETFGCVRGTRGARHLASKMRVNALMTRRARRLRGALRPIARQDARERACDAGRSPLGAPPWRFWAPGPRFSHRHPPQLTLRRASDRAQRAPRSQIVVPGGRGPGPPGANGYEPPPQDATPRSALGCLRRRPSKSEDGMLCSTDAICSQ